MKNQVLRDARRFFLVLLGGVLMAVNINTFVTSAELFPGGFAGVTLLIQEIFLEFWGISLPYSLIVYSFNIVPVIIGFKFIGKKFTLYSVVMIVVSGLLTDFLPKYNLTDDAILCAVFGGIINAAAVSCCLFADSSSGGTDFIAIFISEKTGKSAW
ncbi:YitT family protein, partial [Treponema sp.]|uniref:YitT family protein n=1 Tax=Treponema sp. TaxID=166 RepID=UPI00388F90D9